MEKLVVVIMGQNCERFIDMALESVKEADDIVYCDGGSTDKTLEIVDFRFPNTKRIHQDYDQEDKLMNGKQRNFYLNYVRRTYPDYWCLCIDADEVVEDLNKVKEFIQTAGPTAYSVKMRHLIQDLSHEDATVNTHFVLNRLFKIDKASHYPEGEHPVLQSTTQALATECTTIWHLAYIPNLWEIKKRYDNHLNKSEIHTPEFLKSWYFAHLFGSYPKKQFNPVELPKIILDKFGINKDELYFANRGLELKHFIDAIHWREFFKCKNAIEWGCGRGPRVFALNQIGVDTVGYELSEYAVENKIDRNVMLGDVTGIAIGKKDLSIAYDLLEHIPYEKLNKAIQTLIDSTSKNILISVPVIGDPNLENDPTHIIKETKEWWINQFYNKNCKLIETPDHFLFRDQVMIFEVNK